MNDLNFDSFGFHEPHFKGVELFFKDKHDILHGKYDNEAIRWDKDGICSTHIDLYRIYPINNKQTIYVKDNSEGFYPKRKLKVSWTKDMNNHLEETGWKKVSKEELLNLIDIED